MFTYRYANIDHNNINNNNNHNNITHNRNYNTNNSNYNCSAMEPSRFPHARRHAPVTR